jgi:hypothetical protein
MPIADRLSPETVFRLISYNPDTGSLTCDDAIAARVDAEHEHGFYEATRRSEAEFGLVVTA